MKIKNLLKDPVFHLNLLLWMAKDQPPDGYRVRPFFFERNFEIVYIEKPFPFPVETAKAIQESKLNISQEPEPEMILGRERDKKALYVEAKANSFGTESSTAKQGRGHLIACGPDFAEVLHPFESSLLCYLLPLEKREKMAETLSEMVEQLINENFRPGSFSTHGLSFRSSEIIYTTDETFCKYVESEDTEIVILSDVQEDTNPSPLILVFTDEDHHDHGMRDFYRQVVIEQIRSSLLCDLHAHGIGSMYTITPDLILNKTTNDTFQYCGRDLQKNLRKLIRQNIFKTIDIHWEEKQTGIVLEGNELRISWSKSKEKDEFLNWLEDKRTRFDASKPKKESPPAGRQMELELFPPEEVESK